jgi:hypothetical protein
MVPPLTSRRRRRIAGFDKMLDRGNANARTQDDGRLMRDVPVLFYFANLIRLALAKQLRGLPNVFHNAADREQRVLAIHNATHAARLRLLELNLPLQNVDREFCPRRRAIGGELLRHRLQMR